MWRKLYLFFLYFFAIIGFFLVAGYFAIQFGFTNENGVIDKQQDNFLSAQIFDSDAPDWAKSEEWETLKKAIIRDTAVIYEVAKDADINSRLIVAQLVPEQLRLFHDNRELFKKIFSPLQILGNQNQFSWGIVGIKRETAIEIEQHLKDKASFYYLGKQYEHILDFKTNNPGQERFSRITDEKNHYYPYLYTALYLKQIIKQWGTAGYNISDKPDILSTLYNIGFSHSLPNANPSSGGAEITINGKIYSFGSLANEFYLSDELTDHFGK